MTWAEFNWDWRRQLRSPLVIALLLSLLIHAYIWLMAQLLDAALPNGWLPDWLRPAAQPIAALVSAPKPNPSEKATPPPLGSLAGDSAPVCRGRSGNHH